MSRAPIVDERYRLQPADLAGSAQRVLIQQVSFQGLEEMTPVLHFAGPLDKPLALNASQRRELIDLLHSSLCDDWLGQAIELRPARRSVGPEIQIVVPSRSSLGHTPVRRRRSFSIGPSLWALLLLVAALAAVYWLERAEILIELILDWLR
jgi:hypothetical protein